MEPYDGVAEDGCAHQSGWHPRRTHASPKGLRHGFGVTAVSKGIALNIVQKWLGHSQLATTAIYANAVGEEEQNIASRMWT
jgi:integrase/recombinase XerD